jgi:membrane fusion protein, multidrug efflux system
LSFKIGGVIQRIYVEEGDVVRAGQLLASLDKTEIDAQVSQAKQALQKAERDLARVQGLYRDSSATLELLENATTGRDVAKESARIAVFNQEYAEIRATRPGKIIKKLMTVFNQEYAEIRATRPGKIIKKLMNEGEITGPGMPVFLLFETGANDWVVKASVSDRDWARIQKGMTAGVQLDAYPETKFAGTVSDLSPAADPSNGLYPVEIRIQPNGKRFAPGLFAKVELTPPGGRKYAIVPIEAVMEGDGHDAWVYTVLADGESVQKVPIQVAFIRGANAVISSGLESVQEVISSGAPYLNETKKVKKI